MELTTEHQLVLVALSHQPDGYLAAPHASCFAQFRIDADTVQAILIGFASSDPPLVQLSHVTEQLLNEDDEVVAQAIVDAGWEITQAGRDLAETFEFDPVPSPTDSLEA